MELYEQIIPMTLNMRGDHVRVIERAERVMIAQPLTGAALSEFRQPAPLRFLGRGPAEVD